MGIIWFVTGMHWAFALGYLIMAIVADFVAGAGPVSYTHLDDLQHYLDTYESTHDYDEYHFDLDEIEHDPYVCLLYTSRWV